MIETSSHPPSEPVPARLVRFGGTPWVVRECHCRGAIPGAHGDCCLIFESDLAWRRVWAFPRDWHSLSETELEQLSWKT